MITSRSILCSAVLAVAGSAHSAPTVIDFEALSGTKVFGGTTYGTTIKEDGFRLDVAGLSPHFWAWDPTSETDIPEANYLGSVAILGSGTPTQPILVTLTREDGGAFDLLGLDIASLFKATGAPYYDQRVDFVGVRGDGSKSTESYTLYTYNSLVHHLTFSSLTNVLSVTWDTRGNVPPQIDNIRVQAVPEPASLGALVLGAVTLIRRRNRS